MARGNVENLRALLEEMDLEAWRRGESDMSLLDPRVTYEDTTLPDHVGETYRGPEGVARATERWLEPYERLTYTGIEAEGPVAYLWTFRDGKVIHFRSYRDPDEALAAAGLRVS
jgi:hypothetical protein